MTLIVLGAVSALLYWRSRSLRDRASDEVSTPPDDLETVAPAFSASFEVVDVSSAARVLTSVRGRSLIARQLGMTFVIVGFFLATIGDGAAVSEGGFGIAIAGIGLVLILPRLLRRGRVDAYERGARWVRRGRRRLVVLVTLTLASVAGALGFSVFVTWLADLSPFTDYDSTPGESGEGYIIAAVLFLASSGLFARLARRVAQRGADELRQRDQRPPIVFLRSFADDDAKVFTYPSSRNNLIDRFGFRFSERLEEVLCSVLDRAGPITAVQPPGERRRRLGAAREQLPGDDWEREVAQRIDNASAVVVVLGRTPGVASELEMLADKGAFARTIVVLPPCDDNDIAQRWQTLQQSVPAAASLRAPDRRVLVVMIGRAGMCWVTAERREATQYEVAIATAMTRLSVSPLSSDKPQRRHLPGGYTVPPTL